MNNKLKRMLENDEEGSIGITESGKDFKVRMNQAKDKQDKHNSKKRLNKLANGWKEVKQDGL